MKVGTVPHCAFFILLMALGMQSSCDKHQAGGERAILEALVNRTSIELQDLGFEIDMSMVAVDIMSKEQLASAFNNLDDLSRPEMEDFIKTPAKNSRDNASRLAFYDPNTKTIVFEEGASLKLSSGHLAHELAHAYQDQRWGYERLWRAYQEKPSRELYNIINSVLEGHAELARQAYEQFHSKSSKADIELSWKMSRIHDAECAICNVKNQISQMPYVVGTRFLLHQYQEGLWSQVEAHMDKMPSSTEQLLHPNKWGEDEPTAVSLPLWNSDNLKIKRKSEGCMGEAFLLAKLLSISMSPKEAYLAATGWDGDMAHVYQSEDGKEALLWRLIFDRDEDATQLERSVSRLGMSKNVMKRGRGVDWIITDNTELLNSARIFMSKNPMSLEEADERAMQSTREQEKNFRGGMGLTSFYPSAKIHIKPRGP